jgi:DNA-binding MarR family transcriptional regulator
MVGHVRPLCPWNLGVHSNAHARRRSPRCVRPRIDRLSATARARTCVSMCDVDESDDQPLGYLMYRVMAALRPQAAAELRPLGIGLPELVCMRILSLNPGLTSAELARDNHVSAQAMNQVLNGLQDRGAVTRPTSTPGRPQPAQLTRQGKALLKRAETAIHAADERVLTNLTAQEQRQLKQLLFLAGRRATDQSVNADGD